MKRNVMVIGNRKEKVTEEVDLFLKDALTSGQGAASNVSQEKSARVLQEPAYENVWGNDYSVLNKLEGEILAERRFYTRVLYMQKIECDTISKSMESEPTLLSERIEFNVIDLSVGGIGIVSEYEIMIGTILFFKLSLDNIAYDIKCEVVYCFQNDGKYRAGLRIIDRDRNFITHLKILVARLSLQSLYGTGT